MRIQRPGLTGPQDQKESGLLASMRLSVAMPSSVGCSADRCTIEAGKFLIRAARLSVLNGYGRQARVLQVYQWERQ